MKYAAALMLVFAAATAGAPALAADAGEAAYRRACASCHSLEAGQNRLGPSLWGVVGRAAGAEPGFRYSPAMAGSGLDWSADNLDAFLAAPRETIPGNRMIAPGVADPQARAALIAFLSRQR